MKLDLSGEPYSARLARLAGEAEAMGMTPDRFTDWLAHAERGSLNVAMTEPEHGQQLDEAPPSTPH